MSSAAVVIGALRVNYLDKVIFQPKTIDIFLFYHETVVVLIRSALLRCF